MGPKGCISVPTLSTQFQPFELFSIAPNTGVLTTGEVLLLRQHWAVSGDILNCYSWVGGGETGGAIEHSTVSLVPPHE